MTKIMLCEGINGSHPLIIDRSSIQEVNVEVSPGMTGILQCSGILSKYGVVNGNRRIYSKSVWEANLKENSTLSSLINSRSSWGTLEHPSSGKVDLTSPISHLVVRACMEGDEIKGDILILNTPEGQRLKTYIQAGWNPTVSSRGFGSVQKNRDGIDEVQDDFICEGWDVVSKPSFVQAVVIASPVAPKSESQPAPVAPAAQPPISSAIQPETPKPSAPAEGTSSVTSKVESTTNKKQENPMDKSQIMGRINSLSSADFSTLSPEQIAEQFSQCRALHAEIGKYLTENIQDSWEANKMHASVADIERKLSESVSAPRVTAGKLQTQLIKVASVTEAVAGIASKLKKQLAESSKKKAALVETATELANRGRGWRDRALKAESSLNEITEKYDVVCEAADIVAAQYKDDVTKLGKRVIELEFPEAVKKSEVKEALKNAKTPDDIVKARSLIEGKTASEAPAKPAAPAAPAPDATDKKDTISDAPAASANIQQESAPAVRPAASVKNVNESVELARRLSATNK